MMRNYQPPFTLTPAISQLSAQIFLEIGRLEGAKMGSPSVTLRRSNQIKTIHASLAIEGNMLTIDQVTDLVEGKRVLGPAKDILEVKNALKLYNLLPLLNPLEIKDILRSHHLLMEQLIETPGHFRTRNVGIFKGGHIIHQAPPPDRVPHLMTDLFAFLKKTTDISWLLKSCIFHYEFEFIHPFMDGNGRLGRLWQQLLLMKEHPIFEFIPIEEIIKENQGRYYDVLGKSDQAGESTPFIIFSLETILEALKKYNKNREGIPHNADTRLEYAKTYLKGQWFTRKEYLSVHPNTSAPTASRDLLYGLAHNILESKGKHNQIKYRFKV